MKSEKERAGKNVTRKGIKNKSKVTKFLYYFVLVTLIASAVYVSYRISTLSNYDYDLLERNRSDYILMLLQCILGIFVIHIPDFIERRLSYRIPNMMIAIYVVFLYCAIYLGEVRSFYYLISCWDTILHLMSSMALAALGFSFVNILNNTDCIPVNLSPLFVALFAFCFALTIGSIWEIYEFSADAVLGTNMQKYMLADGTELVGHSALADTMKDIIVDCTGALISSTVGFLSMILGKNKYMEGMIILKSKES